MINMGGFCMQIMSKLAIDLSENSGGNVVKWEKYKTIVEM